MEHGMRIGVEATSLLGPRGGAGHTTASVTDALVTLDEGVRVVLFPLRVGHGARVMDDIASSPRIEVVRGRPPFRVADAVWSRLEWPPAELFCGALDVFWGPNFFL